MLPFVTAGGISRDFADDLQFKPSPLKIVFVA
jgi:hypothetical protein